MMKFILSIIIVATPSPQFIVYETIWVCCQT